MRGFQESKAFVCNLGLPPLPKEDTIPLPATPKPLSAPGWLWTRLIRNRRRPSPPLNDILHPDTQPEDLLQNGLFGFDLGHVPFSFPDLGLFVPCPWVDFIVYFVSNFTLFVLFSSLEDSRDNSSQFGDPPAPILDPRLWPWTPGWFRLLRISILDFVFLWVFFFTYFSRFAWTVSVYLHYWFSLLRYAFLCLSSIRYTWTFFFVLLFLIYIS